MFLHRSNYSERLVDALTEVVRRPLGDPLATEVIVVQSRGMERWLALELSRRLGVFANAEFPFPRRLLERLHAGALGEPPAAERAFDEGVLQFAIAAILPDLLGQPAFEPLARYLAGDTGCALRLPLSDRIARVLDDCAVYRPELLLGWERGQDAGWEAQLFRALVARHGSGHKAARAERLLQALSGGAAAKLPERLCVFGISHLPPLYLRVLSQLSQRIETHLFLLSPSREYFGDLRSPRGRATADPSAGHPLLAGLGKLGREFQDLLEEHTQYQEDSRDLYVDPGEDTLLHALQSDMLGMRARGSAAPRLPIADHDHSIAIHVCHGPMREVEVLHDQLTALLEDETLEPHEIAVMTPDIESYAEVIEAVFGQSSGRPPIPYAIADRKPRTAHEVALALYALLDTLQGRLPASSVLDLLTLACIRRRFGIEGSEVELLRVWVEESGARFCADAEHRAEIGQPALHENTWRFGLDRMLMGYAAQGRGKTLFGGVLPYDPIEGNAAELLGKLAQICERLFHYRKALQQLRPVGELCELLVALLGEFVDAGPETAAEHQLVRECLLSVADAAKLAGFTAPIDVRSLRKQLERALDERLPARGLLSRGVTFCQLLPMRSIPFKVVCLIGMNEGVIPGPNPSLTLGRPSEERARAGAERNRRDDDRYMFLEALLCAREKLLLSYVGRGIHDNRSLPPSVLVSELLDAIAEGFEPAGGVGPSGSALERRARVEQRLCVHHRLHAFSARYFEAAGGGGERAAQPLFSYAADECAAARALGGPRQDPPLLRAPLAGAGALTEITLDELVRFLTHPLRAFAQRTLGLYLGEDYVKLPDREPVTLDKLAEWKLASELLPLALEGMPRDQLARIARARGDLPLGSLGQLKCDKLLPEIEAFASKVRARRSGERLPPLSIALELEGVRITGTLRELWPGAHLSASYSRIGRRFEFAHFVRHVVLGCALREQPDPRYPTRSHVIGRAGQGGEIAEVTFTELEQPEALLRSWLGLVREGCARPLPFVYEASRVYADHAFDPEAPDPARGLASAKSEFEGRFGPASNDDYVKLFYPSFAGLLGVEGPLSFAELANALLGPFMRHRSEA